VDILYERFLKVADHKKVVEDADLSELANNYQKAEGLMVKA
jgi:hypothetical protein